MLYVQKLNQTFFPLRKYPGKTIKKSTQSICINDTIIKQINAPSDQINKWIMLNYWIVIVIAF